MSNTRRAQPGGPLQQGKFSSSQEFNRGLVANLVAGRCSLVDNPADRELIWFIQYLSHQDGGLAAVANNLLAQFSDRLGSASMNASGKSEAQNFTADEIREIRLEMPSQLRQRFPLRGETRTDRLELAGKPGRLKRRAEIDHALQVGRTNFFQSASDGMDSFEAMMTGRREEQEKQDQEEAKKHPSYYPFSMLHELCRLVAVEGIEARPDREPAIPNLERELAELCLDPAWDLANGGPWYFVALLDCLRKYQTEWIEARRLRGVVTDLGRLVEETLDYTLASRRMTLIDGLARTGKTFSAKAWCEQNPGRVRYVEVPSTSDEIGFFRAIARALGVSISLASKAQQLRLRIEETLQAGQLGLVLDEAHYIWPNQIDSRSPLPSRVNWIMTALVNKGVPVCLITTPQFLKNQRALEARTRWTSEQFIGRIGHYQKLPDSLAPADLAKVATALLPEGDEKSIEALVLYAQGSAKYLAGIESVVCRARYLARMQNRVEVIFNDVKNAIKESVIPSDSALAFALAKPEKLQRRGRPAAPMQPVENFEANPGSLSPVPRSAQISIDRARHREHITEFSVA